MTNQRTGTNTALATSKVVDGTKCWVANMDSSSPAHTAMFKFMGTKSFGDDVGAFANAGGALFSGIWYVLGFKTQHNHQSSPT